MLNSTEARLNEPNEGLGLARHKRHAKPTTNKNHTSTEEEDATTTCDYPCVSFSCPIYMDI
eukprot:1395056-Amorphochlora_amoeboformis.AAC.1